MSNTFSRGRTILQGANNFAGVFSPCAPPGYASDAIYFFAKQQLAFRGNDVRTTLLNHGHCRIMYIRLLIINDEPDIRRRSCLTASDLMIFFVKYLT